MKNWYIRKIVFLGMTACVFGVDKDSTGSGSWSDPIWSPAGTPNVNTGTDNVTILGTHNITVNPTADPGPGDFNIRNGNSVTVHDNGSLTHDTNNWLRMAQGSDGTVNVEGGTFNVGAASQFAAGLGGGTANIVVGDGAGAADSAVFTLNGHEANIASIRDAGSTGSANITINSDGLFQALGATKRIGHNGAATFTMNGGTYHATGSTEFASGTTASANFTMGNGSVFRQQTGDNYMGYNGNFTGVMNGNASMLHQAGNWLWVARDAGTSSLTMNGTSSIASSANYFNLGARFSGGGVADGTLTLNDSATVTQNNNMYLGWNSSGTGRLNINDSAVISVGANMNVGHSGNGVVTHNGGSLVVGGWVDLARNPGSAGTYLMNGGSLSAGELSLGNSGQAIFTQNGGDVRIGSLGLGTGAAYTNGGTGTFALEGGTLGVNNINVASGTFTWGDATLTTRQASQNANNGAVDFSAAGFNEVKLGTSISINQNLATAASTLDLNGFYINGGVRFDQLAVTGSLDLSAVGDALDMTINPYLLRPNVGTALDSGEIPLVTATLGITSEFDTGPTFLQDNIGWSEYTGVWVVGSSTAAATLGANEYYLEYDSAGSITLFYKVEGTVPEPGTTGLLAMGLLVARGMRERRRRSV